MKGVAYCFEILQYNNHLTCGLSLATESLRECFAQFRSRGTQA